MGETFSARVLKCGVSGTRTGSATCTCLHSPGAPGFDFWRAGRRHWLNGQRLRHVEGSGTHANRGWGGVVVGIAFVGAVKRRRTGGSNGRLVAKLLEAAGVARRRCEMWRGARAGGIFQARGI